MQKIIKYALIFILFFSACKQKQLIPEKDMVSILVKIQLTDASIQHINSQETFYDKDTINLYRRMIQTYGYTQEQFDSTLSFYTKNPKELDAIYDKVIIELSTLETKILAENKQQIDSIARDTAINYWNLKPSYELPKDGNQSTIDFTIRSKGLGIYTISADVNVNDNDESINPSMVAYFYFDDKSKEGRKNGITSKRYKKTGKVTNYSIKMDLQNSLVTQLKGSLASHENVNKNFTKHISISNIKVAYKPTKHKKLKNLKEGKFLEK